jgi:quinol monooxygenase YgiN
MNSASAIGLCATLVAALSAGAVSAQSLQKQYVQVAEIEIDPEQLWAYKAAVKEHIQIATRVEPGVLVLYAVSETENPTRVRVFEIYRDAEAYKVHLQSDHFKNYKSKTEKMVRSLKLVVTTPIMLGTKGQ